MRREDVAELAGISLNWYGLLESGCAIRVSPQTLDRVSRALRLDRRERLVLFSLALPELEREGHIELDASSRASLDDAAAGQGPLETLVALLRRERRSIEHALSSGNALHLRVSLEGRTLRYSHDLVRVEDREGAPAV